MRPFIGTDDLAALLGTAVSDADLITRIALDSGCQAVRSFLDQTINRQTDITEIVDGHDTKKFRVHERPIRNIWSVTLDGEVVDPTLYNWNHSMCRRVDDIRWPAGYANIEVNYDAGYDIIPDDSTGDDLLVPADMRLVALLAARRVYTSVGTSDGGGKTSESIGQYSYSNGSSAATSAAELLAPEKDVLMRYRIGLVPAR